jgi:hypothetical protein
MGTGLGENGLITGSDLEALLKDEANFVGLSNLNKVKWLEDLEDSINLAVQYLTIGNSTEGLLNKGELEKGQSITFKTADGKEVTGILQDNGDIIADGNTYKNVYRDYQGNYITDEKYQEKQETT